MARMQRAQGGKEAQALGFTQGGKEAQAFGFAHQIVPGYYHGGEMESKTGDMWGASPAWLIP